MRPNFTALRGRARRSSTGGAATSAEVSGRSAAEQVGAGVGEREGPLEPFYEYLRDAAETRAFVPLQQGLGIVA